VTSYEDGDGNKKINPQGDWLISGNASDSPGDINNLSQIRLKIKTIDDANGTTNYWTKTDWQANETDFVPDSFLSKPQWDYTFPSNLGKLYTDQRYFLSVKADDSAKPPNTGSFSTAVEVVIDTTPPFQNRRILLTAASTNLPYLKHCREPPLPTFPAWKKSR